MKKRRVASKGVNAGAVISMVVELEGGLVWEGEAANATVKSGKGRLKLYDGSSIKGCWDECEVLNGAATFTFPDGRSELRGTWKDGVMDAAHFFWDGRCVGGFVCECGVCWLSVAVGRRLEVDKHSYNAESEWPLERPLLLDPYENVYVFVKSSMLPGAGEGLFAKRDIPADFVRSLCNCCVRSSSVSHFQQKLLCFYNGCFVDHDVVDKRSWRYNANTITRDQDFCIDVPAPFHDLRRYCATLGHK